MTDWGSVLTELIPLALVITFSPLSVIPAVLVLQTPKARVTGLTFMAGWLVAIAALTVAFTELAGLIPRTAEPSAAASWVRIIIGALLIAFGAYRWAMRKHASHEPAWMRKLRSVTPAKGFLTAAVLAVLNPKVLFMCMAAGLTIDTDRLGQTAMWASVVWFTAVAGSSVALPALIYAVAGARLEPAMARLGDWLHRQHAVLVAGILIIIGVLMVSKGLQHL